MTLPVAVGGGPRIGARVQPRSIFQLLERPEPALSDAGLSCMPTISKEPALVLTLARTFKYFGFGNVDDYVVLDGDRVIGRIFKPPQALSYRPWFWTITALEMEPSVDNRGYCATREDAMADFKKRRLAAETSSP